jgi:uncharacterized membrane protein YdjX (TVP38/TMEM64 family)
MSAFGGFGRFLTSMDAKAATSLGVSVALMLVVLALFFFGGRYIHVDDEGRLAAWLAEFSRSPMAVPAVMAVFIVLALTGFPQWFLIAGTILAFGARDGALYSWLATMMSATVTFALGRFMGGAVVERFGGARTRATIDFIGRHGILASGLIRVVPSGPFILVNAAAGAARVPLWKYLAGTSVGIVPKILIVAALSTLAPGERTFAGGLAGLYHFVTSLTAADWALFAAVVCGWIGLLLGVRRVYIALRRRDAENPSGNAAVALAPGEESH